MKIFFTKYTIECNSNSAVFYLNLLKLWEVEVSSRHGHSNFYMPFFNHLFNCFQNHWLFIKFIWENFFIIFFKDFGSKFADVIIFWQTSMHKNSCFLKIVLTIKITSAFGIYHFLLIQTYSWIDFFLSTAMWEFYWPDLNVPKWIIFGQKIGLNLGNVVSCYKIRICVLAVGYLP